MAHLNVNFNDVPDKIPQLEPGIYTFLVTEANIERNKKNTGDNLVVELKVDDQGSPFHNRTVKNYISLLPPYGLIGLKKFCKSAGVPLGADGVNTEDLVGKHVKARTKTRTYTDPDTQETRESTDIADFLF